MKNQHECPLKNSPVETRGSQTSDLPPGTVFKATDVPLPAANGSNVVYARPYRVKIHTHDEGNGPFQHSTEATAASVPGERSHHRGPPEDSYPPSLLSVPFRPFCGLPSTMTRTTGNAVGIVNRPTLGQEMNRTGNAAGVVNALPLGQDNRLVYSGSGGGGGGGGGGGSGGSAQQGDEPWQRRGFRGDGDQFGAASMELAPPPSTTQANNYMDETNTTRMMAGNGWQSSLGSSTRPPGGRDSWRYTTAGGEGGAEDGPDFSFRRFSSSSSALPSMTPIPTLTMPSPSPEVVRWRQDNLQVQPSSSGSVLLTPSMESIEQMLFPTVSMGPPP